MANKQLEILASHAIMGGKQVKYRHQSETLGCPMTFSLYWPAVPAETPVDIVWWLSGLTCTDDNFSQKGAFQQAANAGQQVIVIPDTSPRGEQVADDPAWDLGQGAGFYLNATAEPWQQQYQMARYITEELTEIVAELVPQRSGNEGISGHSMGGHGALVLGLRDPARFTSITAFAPILTPSAVPWGQKAFREYLGPDETTWQAWDATALLRESTQALPPILITQGGKDDFYPEQLTETAFLAAASVKKATVRYQKEAEYDHSYFTIATFIGEHLAFHRQMGQKKKG